FPDASVACIQDMDMAVHVNAQALDIGGEERVPRRAIGVAGITASSHARYAPVSSNLPDDVVHRVEDVDISGTVNSTHPLRAIELRGSRWTVAVSPHPIPAERAYGSVLRELSHDVGRGGWQVTVYGSGGSYACRSEKLAAG